MHEDTNPISLSRSATIFFKTSAVLALFPFLGLSAIGRIQHQIHSEWFHQADNPATLVMLIVIAFIGADASRKAGYRNLEAVHGITGGLVAAMLIFKLVPSILLAILLSIIVIPIMYMLIRRIPFSELTRGPREGESELTVLSFIMGKHKRVNKDENPSD